MQVHGASEKAYINSSFDPNYSCSLLAGVLAKPQLGSPASCEESDYCTRWRGGAAVMRSDFSNRETSVVGTYATFPDGRRKAGISPKPDIAGLLSMLVYEFTP
jgi:hypothetical protein